MLFSQIIISLDQIYNSRLHISKTIILNFKRKKNDLKFDLRK